MKRRFLLLAVSWLGPALAGRASTLPPLASDSPQVRRVRVLPVPTVGYAPETSTFGGVVALFTLHLHPTARVSNAKIKATYTARRQSILELGWNYFFKDERAFSRGTVQLSRYPDLYYGIGAATPATAETNYTSDRVLVRLEMLWRLSPRRPLFLGPQLRYTSFGRLGYLGGDAPTFAKLYPARAAGLGLTLLADTRTNLLNPSTGLYAELGASQNQTQAGGYQRLTADLRRYHTWHGCVLAAQLASTAVLGPAPFYDYALLGGPQARGYFYGRFRDRAITSLQGEVRSPQWHRWGLAAFGGVSQLSPSGSWLHGPGLKPNVGTGVRFLADRKEHVNLRLDYAWGADGQRGLYIAFGEAF
ncbi:BamA/TamA family outer membrane protein [Hymenobacter sp. ASUV-10]|uniref:BamA/TamA family outer membrane protein n=1 Tax=Hymenobacter aranciens TaxID=3063996 RepID=A0ABT9B936_9BACT|nr:BamA/TamA family outer membrane protein [Hymenobacter sp. ASUV-10]MDO7874760.1 BamA/TamA family outer membrane protein [Hymenobacter sp. ASUV-10]